MSISIRKWINKGNSESNSFFKFLSYYIAFNCLYNKYRGTNMSEKEAITIFVGTSLHKPSFNNYSIEIKSTMELQKSKIINMRSGKECKYYNLEDLKAGNPISVFMAIYQIRCNLFHGDKSPDASRDEKLVEEASVILKQFLKTYLGESSE